jgi:hypothetical protein
VDLLVADAGAPDLAGTSEDAGHPDPRDGSGEVPLNDSGAVDAAGGDASDALSPDADPCPGCKIDKVLVDGMHMLHDPSRGRLYVTVPATAPSHTNGLVIIDPAAATVVSTLPIGKDPRPLALSDDHSTLWVGLGGDGALRKVTLTGDTPSLGPLRTLPPFSASDTTGPTPHWLVVLPGTRDSVAASVIGHFGDGVAVYDDGVPRPTKITFYPSQLTDGPPGTLFGYNDRTSGYDLFVITVTGTGVSQVGFPGLLGAFHNKIVRVGQRLYAYLGEVIDVSTLSKPVRVGRFAYEGAVAPLRPGRLVMVSAGAAFGATDDHQLRILDTESLTQVAAVPLPGGLLPRTTQILDLAYLGGDAVAFLADDFSNDRVVVVMHAAILAPP